MAVQSTKRLENLSFEIKAGEFNLHSDVSKEDGGLNSAPSPHDYLTVALAACTSITVMMYARRKQWPLEDVDVKVEIIEEGPQGNRIHCDVNFIGKLTAEQKKQLFLISQKCPIHRFLTAGAVIENRMHP